VLTLSLPLGRDWIAARIPHHGRMCLLDTLLACDDDGLRCETESHRDADNPLRAAGRLGAACAIEYAAQAIALHGGLLAASASPAMTAQAQLGLLAAVREVQLHVATLDELPAALVVECHKLEHDARTLLYRFTVTSAGAAVAAGRATIVLGAA
jgi:predicted hotdog family 3-hydroxylacyl-ACP dehydratase